MGGVPGSEIVASALTSFLGYWHEWAGDNSSVDSNMDLWNNAQGRLIGQTATSKEEIAQLIADAINNGHMITDPVIDSRQHDYYQDALEYFAAPADDLLEALDYLRGLAAAAISGVMDFLDTFAERARDGRQAPETDLADLLDTITANAVDTGFDDSGPNTGPQGSAITGDKPDFPGGPNVVCNDVLVEGWL